MTKYKAGDTLITKTILDDNLAEELNSGFYAEITDYKIISHEPAPEPIVLYYIAYDRGMGAEGFKSLDDAKNFKVNNNNNKIGYIRSTFTGNDFTVEKVTE